jgi:hypothetical protein
MKLLKALIILCYIMFTLGQNKLILRFTDTQGAHHAEKICKHYTKDSNSEITRISAIGDYICSGQILDESFNAFVECKSYIHFSTDYLLRILYFEGLTPFPTGTDAIHIYDGIIKLNDDNKLPFKCVKEDFKDDDNITPGTVSQTKSLDQDFINRIKDNLEFEAKNEGKIIKSAVANNMPSAQGVYDEKEDVDITKGKTTKQMNGSRRLTKEKTDDYKQKKREEKEREKLKKEEDRRMKSVENKKEKKQNKPWFRIW